MKRVREDASAAHNGGEGPSKRATRSASAAHPDGGDAGRRDTAASPIRDPSTLILRSPRQIVAASPGITKRMGEVVSKNVDAQTQAFFFRDIQADDQLAEVAYQRGLLMTFHVSSLAASDTPVVIEVPEFATVAYLKRRVTKAKLELGNWCPTERFELKHRLRPGEEGASAEPLTEIDQHGVPILLFNLGYRAGQEYELTIVSATPGAAAAVAEADRVQQESIFRAAAMDPSSMMVFSTDAATRAYQGLLQNLQGTTNPAAAAAALQAQARVMANTAGGYSAEYITPSRQQQIYQAPETFAPNPAPAPASEPEPTASPAETQRPTRTPRLNRAGRWSIDETRALIVGVQAHGMSWAKIMEHFKGSHIDDRRTPVDYKDKWRNLVKAASDPNKNTRTPGLDEDMKMTILRLAQQSRGGVEHEITAVVDGGDTHSGMPAPGTGGMVG